MDAVYTTIVVNNDVNFPLSNSTIQQIPFFQGKITGPKLMIDIPLEITFRHMNTISKVINKSKILPTVDLQSHLDVLLILRLANYFGISMETISAGFAGWVENRKWIDLWYPEYLYPIYLINEDLVDFRKFFRLHKQPFESITKAAKLPEIRANPDVYIEMLLFFKNYDFNICFDQNNDKVKDRIDMLNKERNLAWELFMVNPHSEFMKDYFNHTPTSYPVWDCKGISVVNPPQAGENTVAPLDVATKRLLEFTYGMLEKPLNDAIQKPFPFANVAFAGGAAAKILGVNYDRRHARQSDADLFIFAKTFEERSRIFEEVLNWFRTYNPVTRISRTYYAMRGSVTTIYIKDIARKFQIISINCTNPYEVISRFDLSHIQWCVLNWQFFGTPEACKAMKERVTRFSNMRRLKTNRLIKALHCGYSIYKTPEIIENHIDITQLIEPLVDEKTGEKSQSIQLQKLIRDLYGFWYPKNEPDMEFEEERQHILCQIEKDANANLVTDDPLFVLSNVTIGGNFENDYESVLYSTFNAATIVNRVQGRRIQRVVLRSKHGVIRLTTGILKVTRVVTHDNGLEIVSKYSEESFREFCNQLEGPVYRMFRAGGVNKHILNDAGEIKFTVPRYKLDMQDRRGISCLRSQRGAALNIEEDLKEGDDIQILFIMEILMYPEERAVDLKPVKFVKYVKYDPETAATAVAVEENIDQEIEFMVEETEFDGEIKYEEDNIA